MIDELNNSFLAGQNNYPVSVEETINMITYHMEHDHDNMKGKPNADDAGSEAETSFAQAPTTIQSTKGNRKNKQLARVTSFKCLGKGHYADTYLSEDTDSDASSCLFKFH